MKVISKTIGLGCLLTCSYVLRAQPANLAVSAIPESLLKDANAVVRYDYTEFEVQSVSRATRKFRTITTILNEKAKEHLYFSEFTDKFFELVEAEIKVYDKNGLQISKAGRKQLSMEGGGEGLTDDNRTYFYKVPVTSYPITVDFSGEVKQKGTLWYPDYLIQTAGISVQESFFRAKMAKGMELRYKNQATSIKPAISEKDGYKIFEWGSRNLPAIEKEPMMANARKWYPTVLLAPVQFEMEDFAGDMNNWSSFGKWYFLLNKKTDDLSEERKQFFRNMVKDLPNDTERARAIYDYLQNNFRYVSIQLGIGGWRPFAASFTDSKKYGDCKGLSCYMQSALAAVGIKSHQALINAGYNDLPVDPSFARNGFNHVILCVPGINDTTWLECTSKTNDFGKLGAFTENKNALLITPEGGVLVKTPKSIATDHMLTVKTDVLLSAEDKSGKVHTAIQGTGEFKELMLYGFQHRTDDEKRQVVMQYFSLKQPDTFKADLSGNIRTEKISLSMNTFYDQVCEFSTGGKMFFNRHLHKQWIHDMPSAENRTQDVYLEHPLKRTDTTVYHIPAGWTVESLPAKTSYECEFGKYQTEITRQEQAGTITSVSYLEIKTHIIPAQKYAGAKLFFSQLAKDQGQKWILKKN